MKPSGGLNDHDLTNPSIVELVKLWNAVSLVEPLRQDGTILRDALFDKITQDIGVEGPNRGLSTRLAREFGLTDGGMKSVKTRNRRRLAKGETIDAKRARAVLAAVRAAAEAYQAVMDGADHGDDPAFRELMGGDGNALSA